MHARCSDDVTIFLSPPETHLLIAAFRTTILAYFLAVRTMKLLANILAGDYYCQ